MKKMIRWVLVQLRSYWILRVIQITTWIQKKNQSSRFSHLHVFIIEPFVKYHTCIGKARCSLSVLVANYFYVRWLVNQLTLCRHSVAWAYTYASAYTSAWTTSRPKLQDPETCCFYVSWLVSQLTLCHHSAAWAYASASAWTTSSPKLQGLETCCFF